MTQPAEPTPLDMFTTAQVRLMLPEGATDTERAIGARLKRAGATFIWGWPVTAIRDVLTGGFARPVTIVGTQPLKVYTFDQVTDLVRHSELDWSVTPTALRWHLQGKRVTARRGYVPADEIAEALRQGAGGADWRRGRKGPL